MQNYEKREIFRGREIIYILQNVEIHKIFLKRVTQKCEYMFFKISTKILRDTQSHHLIIV